VEFTSKHMGNLAWLYATCRCADDDAIPLMRDYSNEFVRRRREERRPRGAESSSGEVVSIVGCDDEKDFDSLDPMTLCQWANSYAKAGHKDEELFLGISAAAIPMPGRFDSRHFSDLAYAFALAGHTSTKRGCGSSSPSSSLFDEIAASVIHQILTFSSQHMANTLWASPGLFDAIAREAIPRMREFLEQQLANVAWAFSKFHPPPTSNLVFDRVAEEVVARGIDSFTMQGVAMLVEGHRPTTRSQFSRQSSLMSSLSLYAPIIDGRDRRAAAQLLSSLLYAPGINGLKSFQEPQLESFQEPQLESFQENQRESIGEAQLESFREPQQTAGFTTANPTTAAPETAALMTATLTLEDNNHGRNQHRRRVSRASSSAVRDDHDDAASSECCGAIVIVVVVRARHQWA
jgi:hypothetical protein